MQSCRFFSLTFVQMAKIKRWAWRNLAVRRTTTILLWIMSSTVQQPLESPGTHSADVQTLISDPTMFPWNGNNIRKVRSGGFRSLLLSRWPLKCLARDVISISKQGRQPRAKCILSFHQQLKWASVQQHSVPVFLRTPNPSSKPWLQREQAEHCSFKADITSTLHAQIKFSYSGPIFTIKKTRTGYSSQIRADQEGAWTCSSLSVMV